MRRGGRSDVRAELLAGVLRSEKVRQGVYVVCMFSLLPIIVISGVGLVGACAAVVVHRVLLSRHAFTPRCRLVLGVNIR